MLKEGEKNGTRRRIVVEVVCLPSPCNSPTPDSLAKNPPRCKCETEQDTKCTSHDDHDESLASGSIERAQGGSRPVYPVQGGRRKK